MTFWIGRDATGHFNTGILDDTQTGFVKPANAAQLTLSQAGQIKSNPGGFYMPATALLVVPPTPPSAQQLVLQAMAKLQAYVQSLLATGVHFTNAAGVSVLIPMDPESQAAITAASNLVDKTAWTDGSEWGPLADGSFIALTAADVTAMAIKAGKYRVAMQANLKALMTAIQTNPATDITQGWPSNA